MELRRLEAPEHGKGALALHKLAKMNGVAAFSPAHLAAVQAALASSTCQAVVALEEGDVCGAAVATMSSSLGESMQLISAVVRADLRRQGLGKRMVSALLDQCGSSASSSGRMVAWVPASGQAMQSLLRSVDFQDGASAAGRPSYAAASSWVLMSKALICKVSSTPANAGSSSSSSGSGASATSGGADMATTSTQAPVYSAATPSAGAAEAPSQASEEDEEPLGIRLLGPDDLQAAAHLHKQVTYQGRPVFGSGANLQSVMVRQRVTASCPWLHLCKHAERLGISLSYDAVHCKQPLPMPMAPMPQAHHILHATHCCSAGDARVCSQAGEWCVRLGGRAPQPCRRQQHHTGRAG